MSEFPLYDTLYKNCKDKDLTKEEKTELLEKIGQLDPKGYELLFVLIKIYSNNNRKKAENFSLIPYSGVRVNSNDYTFEFAKIPFKLRQMLYIFVGRHIETMNETRARENTQIPF